MKNWVSGLFKSLILFGVDYYRSLGHSPCAQRKNKKLSDEELRILMVFMENERIQKALPKLVTFIESFSNESIWNVMGQYRDKTVHYTDYEVLYQMGFLDWNENRKRNIIYKYHTSIRDWKTRHKKRHKRKTLDKKKFGWQNEALRIIFPENKDWFIEDGESIHSCENCIFG
jgi:hypothetical protein